METRMGSIIRTGYWAVANLASLALLAGVAAAGDVSTHAAGGSAGIESHAKLSGNSDVRRSLAAYLVPDVMMVRDDGKSVNVAAELNDGRPVVLNFVYTSCTTICPMSSQVFEQFQGELGDAREAVHLMSISIDPEQDTPARLHEYAGRFHALKGWDHYSGTLAASLAVQKAFNAFRGDKMSHIPLTLVRAAPGKPWVRFDGFARAEDLLSERKTWEPAAEALAAR
jgi:protein SCO1